MITVFGADSCEDTQRSMRHLRRLGIPYRYINIDMDPAALERAKALNQGKRRTPTIELDGRVLIEPSNESLDDALVQDGRISREEVEERLAIQNVGDLERAARTGTGLLLVLLGSAAPRLLRWPLRFAGVMLALTGVTGWCPVYHQTGVTSLEGPGDRPAEAQRREWTRRTGGIR